MLCKDLEWLVSSLQKVTFNSEKQIEATNVIKWGGSYTKPCSKHLGSSEKGVIDFAEGGRLGAVWKV